MPTATTVRSDMGRAARVSSMPRSSLASAERPAARLMMIGEAARQSGFTVRALRFYERRGLLPPSARGRNRYRLYSDADLRQLEFIQQAKALGIPLRAIRELAVSARAPDRSMTRAGLLRTLTERIAQTAHQIAMLTRLRQELERRRRAIVRRRRPQAAPYCTCLQ